MFSRILKSKSHLAPWVSLTFTGLIPPPPSPSEKCSDTHSPAQQVTGWGLQAQQTHGKEESKHFFLMPPMQNQPRARGNQSSFLLLAPEQGRSLDLLCLPQCPAHLTQINLSQHHKDAAQEPQGRVCQQEMPELGVSCDPPSLPSLLCSSSCLVLYTRPAVVVFRP